MRLTVPLAGLLFLAPIFRGGQTCRELRLSLPPDYSYLLASVAGASRGSFRWLVNGAAVSAGALSQRFLLRADGSLQASSGLAPLENRNVQFAPGRSGQAMFLGPGGLLTYPRQDILDLAEGTLEMWVALEVSGRDAVYSHDQVLFQYAAPNGDFIQIAQAGGAGIVYAGGTVVGNWQSAWGGAADMRDWNAGEWRHLAFTWSASASLSGRMQFYVDGILAADTNEGRYIAPSGGGDRFSLGGDLAGNPSAYILDEVRILSRPLNAEEVRLSSRREAPIADNEELLPLAQRNPGDQIVFEYTPPGGLACPSTPFIFAGAPILDVEPPSTLLSPGSTTVSLAVQTRSADSCRYAVNESKEYESMTPFDTGDSAGRHGAVVKGLNPDTRVVNNVYLRCASSPDYVKQLLYRALPDPDTPFPRKGNLWGSWLLRQQGMEHAARIDLHLGAEYSPSQIRRLRELNPNALVLTSINTVENTGLAEDYYLHDTNGKRIEVWPGSFRLNLTKSYVAEHQARYAYQIILDSGLLYDGCFFDNFFLSQAWLTSDIYGNQVELDADEDGKPDDPAVLDAKWRAGVLQEMDAWRKLMPYALASGHHFRPPDPDVLTRFNGDSIGFMLPQVKDGALSFSRLWEVYNGWYGTGRTPVTMMLESAPPYQIGYGYGYDPLGNMPAGTLDFAEHYHPYVRFGLATTLMQDGYFAHEIGDTYHGNDWWYDELDFDLGRALGPAVPLPTGPADPRDLITNGGFEAPLEGAWDLWADSSAGAVAAAAIDSSDASEGSASALIRIDAAGSSQDWQIGFQQWGRSIRKGAFYELSFWAKADRARIIGVNSSKGGPDWRNYGLVAQVSLTTSWKRYSVTFEASETASDARIEFYLGGLGGQASQSSKIWIDGVRLMAKPPVVFRRDFENGIALLNPASTPQSIQVGPGYSRLSGTQAPKYEFILDDSDSSFSAGSGWYAAQYDGGMWKASGPYFHNWGPGCRQCGNSCGEAKWNLSLKEDGAYTIAAWWAAAPSAGSWAPKAVFELVSGGAVIASASADQTRDGDQWHVLFTGALTVAGAPYVRIRNAGGGALIADALWIRSAARYNDGMPASSVTLEPFDGIVLRRAAAGLPQIASGGGVVDAAGFLPPVVRGSWATVFGSRLASTTRSWNSADFNGSRMPTSLDGTSVLVNGIASPVSYVSPSQVNFQTPSETATGAGVVQVLTPAGDSNPVSVDIVDAAPEFFVLAPPNRRYAVAHHAGWQLVGRPGLLGPDTDTQPARPGEEIILWGSGFGPTSPAAESGILLAAPLPLADLPRLAVSIGGKPAAVTYGGMTVAGVYQIQVIVPDLPEGDSLLVATIGSVASQPGVYLTIGSR